MKEKVRCNNCSSLAMAKLDGVDLCAGCLMVAALGSEDPTAISRIVPLELLKPPKSTRPQMTNKSVEVA